MDRDVLNIIRGHDDIYNYLREESFNYKYLYRDKNYIKKIENLARERYEEGIGYKLNRLSKSIEVLKAFIE